MGFGVVQSVYYVLEIELIVFFNIHSMKLLRNEECCMGIPPHSDCVTLMAKSNSTNAKNK